MEILFDVDWAALFLPETPLLEIFIRGTVVYLVLFFMLRFLLRREVGSMGITDLLMLVLLADAAQNAMAADYQSLPDGILLVATIVGWSYLLDWLAYRSPLLRRLIRPPKVQVVKEGRILRRALDREKLTEEELMGEIRSQGVASLEDVREAYIETDGMLSVIAYEKRAQSRKDEKRKPL